MLKIASWNIRQGGGTRTSAIISTLLKHRPAIIVLSEFRNNANGTSIRSSLLRSGYIHQLVSAAASDVNSVLIASKLPFDGQQFHNQIKDFPFAILRAGFEAFDIFGMYLPHKKKHTLFPFLINELARTPPAILCGDFNTGYNFVDQKGDSFWYTEYLDQLVDIDYLDVFRHFHPHAREYSWFSHGGNGYRYDHIWIHEDIGAVVKNSYYAHDVREEGISDHSLQILEFKT